LEIEKYKTPKDFSFGVSIYQNLLELTGAYCLPSFRLAAKFFLAKALNKPIYNKMHNVWQDDPYGRTIADFCTIISITIAFLLGLLL